MARAGQALAVDPLSGLTHLAWNEDGLVHTAYYNPDSGRWVDASAIPGSTSGQGLALTPNVVILEADGTTSRGLVATWTLGEGNAAETVMAVGRASPLGAILGARQLR